MKDWSLPLPIKDLLLYICAAALFFFLEVLSFDRIRWKPLSPLSEVATGLRHHEAKLNSIKKGSAAAVSKH